MSVITEEGRLFGLINIIDLLAILLFLSLIIGGVTFTFGKGGVLTQQTTTLTVTTTASVPGYVATSIQDQSIQNEHIKLAGIEKTESELVRVTEDDEIRYVEHQELTITLTLEAFENNGELRFGGQRLLVGRTLELDFGTAIVDVTVTSIEVVQG